MPGYLRTTAIVIMCALGGAMLGGCAETTGISAYPDLSNIKKASGEGMSQQESSNMIKTLQNDKNTHKEDTIREIKSAN